MQFLKTPSHLKQHVKKLSTLISLATFASLSQAQAIQGISFQHQEWQISCSNTGTCQAAGYQADDSKGLPASILLTRKAGPAQQVNAEFVLAGDYGEDLSPNHIQNIHFYINNKDLGPLRYDAAEGPITGTLSSTQRDALLKQAQKSVKIEFANGHYLWRVSDAGMTATLLKMDDFQKRVGTVGALIKKGSASEAKVLAAQAPLKLSKVKTADHPYLTLQPQHPRYAEIHRSLMAAHVAGKDEEFCEGIYEEHGPTPQAIELYKLSNNKVLATTLCWRGAYNAGSGAWVLNQDLKGDAYFITDSLTDVEDGQISATHKGRGLGDCWGGERWTWTGEKFVLSSDWHSGQCKGIPGGAWHLERIESDVK